jgi:predicted dehydrogenase
MTGKPLRIGIIGAGYFGRFHAQKVAAGARSVLSGIHDPMPDRAAALAAELGAAALDHDALLAASDAVVIASPAATHHEAAAAALRAGRHVLVEKPIAATLAQADALIALAAARGLVLQVGHLLRYAPERAAILARMPAPDFIACTRIAPFKPRGTDVSVVLDLMIHDLDMVLSLVEAPLAEVHAAGARLASAHADTAQAWLRFADGRSALLVASRVAARMERRMELTGPQGLLDLDFTARTLRHLPPDGAEVLAEWPAADLIAAEHEAFAAAILDGAAVPVDGPAGRRALAAALMVEAAIGQSNIRPDGIIRSEDLRS